MSVEEAILDKVEALSGELVELARRLISTPSENPPGDERAVSQLVSEELESLGFEVEFIEPAPKRVNTVATLRGEGGGRCFLFNGHYDVVPPGNPEFWSVNPYKAVVMNGRIYGRGASDMKGAIASAIIAAKALQEVGVALRGDLLIHAVADEETGSKHGTKYLVERGHITREKVDMAVVGEGSVFKDHIYARPAVRGLHWVRIVTRGKATHSSRPEEGVNAVLKMCRILLALKEYQPRYKPHSLLPDPTVAPGTMVRGGTKENIIPELCEATCDIRVVPGMTREETLREIEVFIEALKEEDPKMEAEVSTILWWPPSEISISEEVYRIAEMVVEKAVGYSLEPRGTSGSNDTTWLTTVAKIPAMAFGPGENYMSGVHGADEWVSIDRLIDFSKIYSLMYLHACGVSES